MRRHSLDLFSLLAGLLFFVFGVLYVLGEYTSISVNARLVFPMLFIWLGVAGLVAALVAQYRSDAKVREVHEVHESHEAHKDSSPIE